MDIQEELQTSRLFTDAELDVLESLTKFGMSGALSPDEITLLRTPEAAGAVTIGTIRRARRLLAETKIKAATAGDSLVKMNELRGILAQFTFSEELEVFQESLEQMMITFYMLFNALKTKGLITDDEMLMGAATSEADMKRMEEIMAHVVKDKEEKNDGDGQSEDGSGGSGKEEDGHESEEVSGSEGEGGDQTTH